MVIAELALGSLANRAGFLALLANLPRSARASDDEVLAFIESQAPFSRGLSVVDVHLLAAVRLSAGSWRNASADLVNLTDSVLSDGSGQSNVTGDETPSQRLGECHVGGVVRAEVVSKIPNSAQ